MVNYERCMKEPRPKTLEEHIEFCVEMSQLMLWFAVEHVRRHPGTSLGDTLCNQTCIDRFVIPPMTDPNALKGGAYATPAWHVILEKLRTIQAETAMAADTAARFEKQSFKIIRDAADITARATYRSKAKKPNGLLGALSYEPPKPENPRRVIFHIGNPLQPRSVFDDPGYLPGCLVALMNDAEQKFGASEMFTGTWLNSYPPFLRCFPPEYFDSVPLPKRYFTSRGYGTWGQFVNARGCFNHKYGNLFRTTGEMPFRPARAWCSFAALRRHLAKLSDAPPYPH